MPCCCVKSPGPLLVCTFSAFAANQSALLDRGIRLRHLEALRPSLLDDVMMQYGKEDGIIMEGGDGGGNESTVSDAQPEVGCCWRCRPGPRKAGYVNVRKEDLDRRNKNIPGQ